MIFHRKTFPIVLMYVVTVKMVTKFPNPIQSTSLGGAIVPL